MLNPTDNEVQEWLEAWAHDGLDFSTWRQHHELYPAARKNLLFTILGWLRTQPRDGELLTLPSDTAEQLADKLEDLVKP